MAGQQGFYLDPPSRRLAYHIDGSKTYHNATLLTSGQAGSLNHSSTGNQLLAGTAGSVTIIFPEKRDLTHYRAAAKGTGHGEYHTPLSIQVSYDAISGDTGAWTTVVANYTNDYGNFNINGTRNTIHALPGANGVIGVRFNYTGHGIYTGEHRLQYHVYGHIPVDIAPHRVVVTQGDGELLTRDFDYGDRPNNIETTWDNITPFNQESALYVRNISPEKAAKNIALSFEGVPSTSMSADMRMSTDNNTFSTTLTIPRLNPLESVQVWIRRVPQIGEGLGLHQSILKSIVSEWVDPSEP